MRQTAAINVAEEPARGTLGRQRRSAHARPALSRCALVSGKCFRLWTSKINALTFRRAELPSHTCLYMTSQTLKLDSKYRFFGGRQSPSAAGAFALKERVHLLSDQIYFIFPSVCQQTSHSEGFEPAPCCRGRHERTESKQKSKTKNGAFVNSVADQTGWGGARRGVRGERSRGCTEMYSSHTHGCAQKKRRGGRRDVITLPTPL